MLYIVNNNELQSYEGVASLLAACMFAGICGNTLHIIRDQRGKERAKERERLRAALIYQCLGVYTDHQPRKIQPIIQIPAEWNGHYIIIVIDSRLLYTDSNHPQVYTEWHE